MKNIHRINGNIYITNTEEINKDTKTCWCIDISCNELVLHQGVLPSYHYKHYKKIIMTTDKSINVLCSCGKDCGAKESGVQAIDDEFLEWFVKNPSCEFVEVERKTIIEYEPIGHAGGVYKYKTIIQKEEPKQETLEEVAENKYPLTNVFHLQLNTAIRTGFIEGAKWQQQQNKNLYSEQTVTEYAYYFESCYAQRPMQKPLTPSEWFEQFKKK